MALLFLLIAAASTWGLGAVQLWPRMRWTRELPLWLGGALALGAAGCITWGFVGVLRRGDWTALSTDQTVHRLFGPGSLWFQSTGWGPLDRITNAYVSLDLVFTLVALSSLSMHGYVFWAGVAERRRQARVKRSGI